MRKEITMLDKSELNKITSSEASTVGGGISRADNGETIGNIADQIQQARKAQDSRDSLGDREADKLKALVGEEWGPEAHFENQFTIDSSLWKFGNLETRVFTLPPQEQEFDDFINKQHDYVAEECPAYLLSKMDRRFHQDSGTFKILVTLQQILYKQPKSKNLNKSVKKQKTQE